MDPIFVIEPMKRGAGITGEIPELQYRVLVLCGEEIELLVHDLVIRDLNVLIKKQEIIDAHSVRHPRDRLVTRGKSSIKDLSG